MNAKLAIVQNANLIKIFAMNVKKVSTNIHLLLASNATIHAKLVLLVMNLHVLHAEKAFMNTPQLIQNTVIHALFLIVQYAIKMENTNVQNAQKDIL